MIKSKVRKYLGKAIVLSFLSQVFSNCGRRIKIYNQRKLAKVHRSVLKLYMFIDTAYPMFSINRLCFMSITNFQGDTSKRYNTTRGKDLLTPRIALRVDAISRETGPFVTITKLL